MMREETEVCEAIGMRRRSRDNWSDQGGKHHDRYEQEGMAYAKTEGLCENAYGGGHSAWLQACDCTCAAGVQCSLRLLQKPLRYKPILHGSLRFTCQFLTFEQLVAMTPQRHAVRGRVHAVARSGECRRTAARPPSFLRPTDRVMSPARLLLQQDGSSTRE